jgi:tetratricopeptide (TPR) repeat protein/tRNA A-37 threonylcarbamoyl transferase component Bud32
LTSAIERLNVALADRYRVDRHIGAGGMASVYVARDLRHGRDVAIKVLDPDLAATVGADRFQREISIAARLQHPNILTVLDSGDAEGQLWYAMPFVQGESLRARLAREGELPINDAIAIAGEVAGALDHAHQQGVVHRDIKPENILFSNGHALVADFGIARVVDDATSRLTATGLAVGTPAYMSPEQATGERNAGPASDIYSLACVTFEMLTGEAPYTGANARAILTKRLTDPVPSPRRLRASITPALDREIMRGLSPTPSDRHATATGFAEALKAAARDTVGGSRTRSPIPRVAAALGVVVVAALLLLPSTRRKDVADEVQRGISLLARRTPAAGMEAMAAFQRALAADSTDAEALAGLSYTYALFADWGWEYPGLSAAELRARALDHAERAIAADSGSAAAWMSRAYILTLNDPYRLEGAIASFRRSLGIDSLTAEGWYQFGQALMQLGEDSAAADAYRRAFALDPNRPMALMSLAALSIKAGRVSEAKGLIDSAVAASPTVTSPYVRVVRGRIALLQGDRRAARDEAELALALDTGYTIPARSLLVAVLQEEGDRVAARREVARMMSDAGEGAISPTTARYLAVAQISVGQMEAALSTIERARPRGAYLWFYLQSPDFAPLAAWPRFRAILAETDPRRRN